MSPHRLPILSSLPAPGRWRHGVAAVLLALAGPVLAQAVAEPAPASDGPVWSWSAFGTVGWAQSDHDWHYQRSIDKRGTFQRDTVFGAQLDAQLTPQWSGTLQVRLAPSNSHDARWDLRTAWAFAAWRPNNDWLVRVGKLRVPFLMRSEQLDVGQTYDEARLPAELYAIAPTSDFTGLHVTRNLGLAGGDASIEGYVGQANMDKRVWIRQAIASPVPGQPDLLPAGALFRNVDVSVAGAVFTWRDADRTLRAGVHRMNIHGADGLALIDRPVWAPLGPGIGYWQTGNQLPGPGVQDRSLYQSLVLGLGADLRLNGDWRVAGEAVRMMQSQTELSFDIWAAYGTLYRSWGAFTPYVTLAGSRSLSRSAYWATQLETTTVPAVVPGADLLNGSMRALADSVQAYNQTSLALGSSYALTPNTKLKLEWLHSRTHDSRLVDTPAGESTLQRRSVNVLSASYSFVF